MKLVIGSSFYEQDLANVAHVLQSSEKKSFSGSDQFPVDNVNRQVFVLNKTSADSFYLQLSSFIQDPSKISFIFIDIQPIGDDTVVPRFGCLIGSLDMGNISQLNLVNLENGLLDDIQISNISNIPVDGEANLYVIVGLKN